MPTDTYTTPGNDTWECPAGVYEVRLRIWSAGNAGGEDSGGNGGGGGAGGGFVEGTYYTTPGLTYNLRIGAGGVRGTVPEYRTSAPDGQGDITVFGGAPVTSGPGTPYWLHGAFVQPNDTYAAGADYGEFVASCDSATSGRRNYTYGGFGLYSLVHPGGTGSCGSGATGGGGGSSAGVGVNGNPGDNTGVGGAAPILGAAGGDHGANGDSPGGGGGGASNTETAGDGGDGRIEITYTLSAVVDSFQVGIDLQDVGINYYHAQVTSFLAGATFTSVGLAVGHVAAITSFLAGATFTDIPHEASSFHAGIDLQDPTIRRTYAAGNWSPGFPLPPIPPGGGSASKPRPL